MKLCFLLVRRVPPVPSPVLVEVAAILRARGFEIDSMIAEEVALRPDRLRPEHDLYVLKSHTQLSLSIAGVLAAQGARMLNPYASCTTVQNKIVTSRFLQAADVPVPRSWVTGDLATLRDVVATTPLIVKPYQGHRGAGIQIVRTPADLIDLPPPEEPVIVQELIEGTGEDLKLYVVGDDVFGVRKPFSETSFTVPGRPCEVAPELVRSARRCGEVLGLGLYGLDVIESATGHAVVDVNYFPGYKGVPDVAPRIARYIESYARGDVVLPEPTISSLLDDALR